MGLVEVRLRFEIGSNRPSFGPILLGLGHLGGFDVATRRTVVDTTVGG
jgi:hypothetical protein